jgi:hypothetical protein
MGISSFYVQGSPTDVDLVCGIFVGDLFSKAWGIPLEGEFGWHSGMSGVEEGDQRRVRLTR